MIGALIGDATLVLKTAMTVRDMKISEEKINREDSDCLSSFRIELLRNCAAFSATFYLFQSALEMLGEMLDEILDRLTTSVGSHSNIKEKCWAKRVGEILDRLIRALRLKT